MRKYLRHLVLGLMTLGLVFGMTGIGAAVTVSLVDGDWTEAVPAAAVTIANSGATGGLSTARWGIPAVTGGSQSGYDFQSRTPIPFSALTDGSAFALGNFTHHNWPIYAPSLETIDLDIVLGIDGATPLTFTATFDFVHNETTNPNPDVVTITNPIVNELFTIGSAQYYFNLFGFSQDGGNTLKTSFITTEGLSNVATLYGKITAQPEDPVATPEPLTLVLLGLGLCGVAGLRMKLEN